MAKRMLVYVGTYTEPIRFGTGQILEGKGEGIYLFDLDLDTGELELLDKADAVNPSYLSLDSNLRFLYAVNELKEFEGKASGAVSAFKVDPKSGGLTFINQRATQGTDPCHVALNKDNTHVFVSNFMSGSVCVFPIEEDGSLGEAAQFIQHEGSSIDPHRQAGPHAHSLVFDLANRYALVPDLGKDMVMIYRFDKDAELPLVPGETPYVKSEPGAGPRHCVFHPSGNLCYVINELDSTISAFGYDQANGNLSFIHTVSTIPEAANTANSCADIQISPDGRFVYGSNRGHDSIAIYSVDSSSGKLKYVGFQGTGGKIPRNFVVDPTGAFLLVGNQDTDNIVVFRIDRVSGTLKKVAEKEVPTPVCIKPYLWS